MRTLVHISDLHFGRVDSVVVAALRTEFAVQRPDFAIISGDLVQRARQDHFAAARSFLDGLPCPRLVVPGNHDIPVFNPLRRFGDPFRLYRRHVSPDLSPLILDSELAILGFNTARRLVFDFSQGRIGREQETRAREIFETLPADRVRIVVTHHPFLPPPDAPHRRLVGRARAALPALAAAGTDLLLAGHFHRAYSGEILGIDGQDSILSVQAASATSTRLRGEPNAYNLIRIDSPDAIEVEVRSWDGKAFGTGSRIRYRRDSGRWHGSDVARDT